MKRKMTEWYIKGQIKMRGLKERFLQEEKGASHLVEIVVVVLIVIAVATIFRDQLTDAMTQAMGKLTSFTGEK